MPNRGPRTGVPSGENAGGVVRPRLAAPNEPAFRSSPVRSKSSTDRRAAATALSFPVQKCRR